jgi:hypothetical protein
MQERGFRHDGFLRPPEVQAARRGAGRRLRGLRPLRGLWDVRQRDENPNATTFLLRAIDEYTRGDYEETRWARPKWSELVQTFSTASGEGDLQQ